MKIQEGGHGLTAPAADAHACPNMTDFLGKFHVKLLKLDHWAVPELNGVSPKKGP